MNTYDTRLYKHALFLGQIQLIKVFKDTDSDIFQLKMTFGAEIQYI